MRVESAARTHFTSASSGRATPNLSLFAGRGTGLEGTRYEAAYDPSRPQQALRGSYTEHFPETGETIRHDFSVMLNTGGAPGDPAFSGGVILRLQSSNSATPRYFTLGGDSADGNLVFYRGFEDEDPMFGRFRSMEVLRFIRGEDGTLTVGSGVGSLFCEEGDDLEPCGWGSYTPNTFVMS
jgi:hypothetical protein